METGSVVTGNMRGTVVELAGPYHPRMEVGVHRNREEGMVWVLRSQALLEEEDTPWEA